MKCISRVSTSIGCLFFTWALQTSAITKKDEAWFIDPKFNRSYLYNRQYLEDRAYVNDTNYWQTNGSRGVPQRTELAIKEIKFSRKARGLK